MEITTFTISSEADAWLLLKQAIEDKLPEGAIDIQFSGWPVLEIKLNGAPFDSSLTTKMMESFIDLQKDIYRAYANIFYNKPSGKALTDAEKNTLEIVVKVSPGSSTLKAALEKAADTFVKEAVKKMEAKHIVITVLGSLLIWSGNSCFRGHLDHQLSLKQIEAQSFSNQQDVERMKILTEAVNRQPVLVPISLDAIEGYNKILKGASRAESVEIAGKTIPKEMTEKLVRPARSNAQELQLNGECRILKVDSSKPDCYMVEVRYQDGRIFTARLEEGLVSENQRRKSLLQTAEWGKSPIYLKMNGRELRGEITQATILDVEPIP